jgi:hypothetical protein
MASPREALRRWGEPLATIVILDFSVFNLLIDLHEHSFLPILVFFV